MTTLPDYAVSPGDHIEEWLDDQGINAAELARRLDVTPKHVSELLSGKAPLSATVALGLERVTGIPARIWNRFEAGYREDLARARAKLIEAFKKAALVHLKTVMGRDLQEECRNWKQFEVLTDEKARGTVTIRIWQCDERAPRYLSETITINKRDLIR